MLETLPKIEPGGTWNENPYAEFRYVLHPGMEGTVGVGEGVWVGGTVAVEVGVTVAVAVGGVDVTGVDVRGVDVGGVEVVGVAVVGTTAVGEGVTVATGVPATLMSTHHG